jgi:branched-subunit amino acid aminotransferase/4-amino-4-deoxychorismate lyase
MADRMSRAAGQPMDYTADSAFLSGTAAEIIGIKQVDHIIYKEEWEHSIGATIQRKYKKRNFYRN